MRLLDRVRGAWRRLMGPSFDTPPFDKGSGSRATQDDPSTSSGRTEGMREAVGVTVDADDDSWRRLTGTSARDLSPITQSRMQELAVYLWKSNLLANRLIELPVAYLLAEGVQLTAADPEAQGWLDKFWRDPINSMDLKLPKKVRELAIFGEQCWPAFVNEATGHVRLGYLDPGLIETVVTDPDNVEQPIGIVTKKDSKGRARRYRVIVNGGEDAFTARTREIRATFDEGDCFYYRVNDLSSAVRGCSDLLSQIDWADAYEQFMFGELERGQFLRAFVWDVTLTGATPDEVKARAAQITAPSAGSVRVHNDAETWQAVSPDLGQYESAAGARLFRNHMLGGATMPEHWFGGGGDVNRSTGDSMGEPTFKVYSMRQRIWKHILEDLGAYVIAKRLAPGDDSGFELVAADPEMMPEAVFPELTSTDTTAYASALQQVVTAAAMAIDRGLMTEETGVRVIQATAGRLGIEYDAEEELKSAREESAKRREADVFAEPPVDPTLDAGAEPPGPNAPPA